MRNVVIRTNHTHRILWCVVVFLCSIAYAESKSEVDLPPELMDRYEILIAEVRCPKCLNINIADSNAPIATDLRMVVKNQLLDGKSNSEIKAFLRERYGDFIDYNPPISPATLVLWAVPIVLLICAALTFTFVGARRDKVVLTDEEKTRLQRLKAQQPS